MAAAPATAQGTAATVQEIERQRQALQDNTARLRTLLQEWRLWDVEYEALKEEVEEARGRADLLRIRRNFEGRLVNSKEVAEIFTGGRKAGGSDAIKSADQIINQLDRRLDYVQRNIESLEKQIEKAEDRAAAAAAAEAAAAGSGDGGASGAAEDGLPIMDIVEELDDDDNVVSFKLQRPAETEAKVSEVLKKAGVELKQNDDDDSSDEEGDAAPKKRIEDSTESTGKLPSQNAQSSTASPVNKSAPTIESQTKPPTPTQAVPAAGKKGVSFSEDTKPAADNNINGATKPMQTKTQKKIEEIMRQAREQEQMGTNPPVIPDDESDDDAKLRRDMLAYSMNEIGPVVAELELEEAYSDDEDEDEDGMEDYGLYDDDDEDAYDDDDDYDDDEDEEEDERGRSKRSALSPAYRRRMLELEKKLGVGRQSVGKQPPAVAIPDEPEEDDEKIDYNEPRLGRIAIRSNPTAPAIRPKPDPPAASAMKSPTTTTTTTTTTTAAASTVKKGVRFAQEVDIAEEPTAAPLAKSHEPAEPKVEPVSDIIERAPPAGPKQAPTRFLETMEPKIAPSGPEGRTLADAVLERQPVTKPREPSEFDADLLHQEAAVEYHRLRNKMIQREGGFTKEKESAIEPLDESEGGPKKMSRFKAARLGRA
ncbi:uncharacterized protein PpBr36_05727 [Pyricularia pennisetigena]|uniref:uncharacterized protein n=1 Tax=Pyricularia pennisetigena TaxID=1578925 RepID=UPI001150BE7B|nr:uncharacterized protein PpBr36_05727 [Pyricularia pennisetigena]TLS23532.1 hypothetical protein PpBr36_05727 [Pyricularia pennisetigena]